MRVLYLSQYFPPEIGATQTRALAMARGLVRAGHRVTMLTEFPNHPGGVIPPRYRGKLCERETIEGIDVVRVPVWASPRKEALRRIGFYASYAAAGTVAGLALRGPFDVVYATSPPLFAGGAGAFVAALRRAPFVLEVRDVWPESAVQLGELRGGRVIAWAERLERYCYRRARRVVAVTEGCRGRLIAKGVAAERVDVIPNGADTTLFRPKPPPPDLRQRLDIAPDAFVVLYAGLHGLAHGLETVLAAAALLRDAASVVFLFVGDGPRKEDLRRRARELSLDAVRFHDAVAEPELPDFFAAADVGLDVRRRLPMSEVTLPVKMFSAMACERPVLLATEGEAAQLVRGADAGVVVPPESPEALAAAIRALQSDRARCAAMGRNGRRLVTAKYDRADLARRLVTLLEGIRR